MRQQTSHWLTNITAPSRRINGWVDVYRDSTLIYEFNPEDKLVSAKIENTTESGSLFGYTLCQKATVEILNQDNNITIQQGDRIEIWLGVMISEDGSDNTPKPSFYVEEITSNETNGNITIVAYDAMNKATKHKQKELAITYPINLAGYASQVATILGTSVAWEAKTGSSFTYYSYTEALPPNFSGEETLRDVLNDIAEITGTICFIDVEDKIRFKMLNPEPVLDIDKSLYFEFKLGDSATISQISHATELGDNLTAGNEGGYNAIIRNNAFISLREDIPNVLDNLLRGVNGLTFYTYDLKWRGNPALEIGDKVTVTLKDDSTVDVYYLGETLTYDGGLVATAAYKIGESESIDSNPTTIGEAINKTYAKVDKVNQTITLYAEKIEGNASDISQIIQDAEKIVASVEGISSAVEEGMEGINDAISVLEEKATVGITKSDVTIAIDKALSNGVEKVETSTGYKFDEDGLTISKSNSEISTQITENGMTVSQGGSTVLSANNNGVNAKNLHATTFLIIGDTSRFETFTEDGETRVGCFWIG